MVPIKVLACDDKGEILDLFKMILNEPEFRVMTVQNSSTIFLAIDEFRPDKIVLDLKMPDRNGEEILQILKADARTACIPVIICSASLLGASSAQKFGADHFLMKPFDLDEFLEVLRN